MNLDSVRELKQALSASLLSQLSTPVKAFALGGATRPMSDVASAPPTLALGIAARKGSGSDFQLAVRVQRRGLEGGKELETIKKRAKGEVDVRYIGSVRKRAEPWQRQRQRPLRIGSSVGHFKVTAGTLGCFVRPVGGGALGFLSNNHVLANEDRGKRGDLILQPGAYDGGTNPDDAVALLGDTIKYQRGKPNLLDAAVAILQEHIEWDVTKITGLGKLKGLGPEFVDKGTAVRKLGRTTGLTHGQVTAFEMDNVGVEFDVGILRFNNQIEIESTEDRPFSLGGDSGSLIVDEQLSGLGLLFAGSDQGGANGQGLTYANPLHAVFNALKVELPL